MTRDAAWCTYAKPTRASIRLGLQCPLVLFAVTLLVYWRWGYRPWTKGLLIVSALFAAMAVLKLATGACFGQRTRKDREAPAERPVVPNDDFGCVADPDGDWFERQLLVDGQPRLLRRAVKLSPEKLEPATLFAAALLGNPAETMKKFEPSKSREVGRRTLVRGLPKQRIFAI